MYVDKKNENQLLISNNKKLSNNQFTKSLTSFHTKKPLSSNLPHQSTTKKVGLSKKEKSAKNKKVYLSK